MTSARGVADVGSQVSPRPVDESYTAAYIGVSVQTVHRMRARRTRGETGTAAGPAFVRIMSARVIDPFYSDRERREDRAQPRRTAVDSAQELVWKKVVERRNRYDRT